MNDLTKVTFLRRLCEYWKDKKLSEKCDVYVEEICIHEPTFVMTYGDGKTHTCIKCGAFYE